MEPRTKWLLFAITGLLLIGFGLSLLGEAIIMKYTAAPQWVAWGTFALMVTNSGLCLFGQAIIVNAKEM